MTEQRRGSLKKADRCRKKTNDLKGMLHEWPRGRLWTTVQKKKGDRGRGGQTKARVEENKEREREGKKEKEGKRRLDLEVGYERGDGTGAGRGYWGSPHPMLDFQRLHQRSRDQTDQAERKAGETGRRDPGRIVFLVLIPDVGCKHLGTEKRGRQRAPPRIPALGAAA